jgi:selenocysteine-specific elongation factor
MYVVGTAGHVDHGKSTLVKALTGIDPDRWEEEQRREMTIDLGFAWLTLADGRALSLIDVPGHERFIKNMLAGVGGIDATLLIIAADESVMPQTEEHLAILDLLDIRSGVVVLTKADLVEPDWLALVEDDVRARLATTTLADAPIVAVSARTGAGLSELRATLADVLRQTPSRAEAHGAARLPIDRSFTIGGFGAVVTGTLIDGPLQVGDEVEILPRGLRARVRGLQTHQRREERALPGTRVAVNLSGISHHDMARGDLLALPGRVQPTDLLDAQLRVAPNARPVQQNDRLELFVGACEVACRITLLDAEQIVPGMSGWVQLRLERPIAALRGDRYILRQPSPSQTLGGGRIVDTRPARHRRFRAEVLANLEALARGTPADLVRRTLGDQLPHTRAEIQRAAGISADLADEGMAELIAEQQAVALSGVWLISAAGHQALQAKVAQALEGYHRRYPLRAGMPREELRSRLKLSADAFDALAGALDAAAQIELQATSVRRVGFTAQLSPEQERIVQQLLAAFGRAPYAPPAPDLDPEVLALLYEQGRLVRVAADLAFLPATYREMVGWVESHLATNGTLTVAEVRDRFTTSRKYALALLEHLDERRLTRRTGDLRVLY